VVTYSLIQISYHYVRFWVKIGKVVILPNIFGNETSLLHYYWAKSRRCLFSPKKGTQR